jgi:hypothetical protein
MNLGGIEFAGPFASKADIQNLPGVYVIVGLGGVEPFVIEVGEAEVLRDRLILHERERRWRELARGRGLELAYLIHYVAESHRPGRAAIREALCKLFDPPCGNHGPASPAPWRHPGGFVASLLSRFRRSGRGL